MPHVLQIAIAAIHASSICVDIAVMSVVVAIASRNDGWVVHVRIHGKDAATNRRDVSYNTLLWSEATYRRWVYDTRTKS